MTPQSAKSKGRIAQQAVASRLRAVTGLPEADICSRPMGSQGPDIMMSSKALEKIPYAIEVKKQESLNVWKAFEQAREHARASAELQPLLVISRNRTSPLVVMDFEDFLKCLISGQ